jgi:hypothetical protein
MGQRERQAEFGKDRAVAFQNQSAAIDERSIEIKDNQVHKVFPLLQK